MSELLSANDSGETIAVRPAVDADDSGETVAVRPAVDADPATQVVVRKRRGRVWTYRWPIAVGLAGVAVAAAVTVVALRPGDGATPVSPPAGPTTPPAALLWKTQTGTSFTEPPAVSGDRIVLSGTDGKLRGYRRDDGTLAWTAPVGPGARVAAGIPGQRAYAVTTDGHLVAVDTRTGETAWRRSTGTRFDARPMVGAGRVYAGGRDGVLYAYALAGNHTRWRVWADNRFSMTPALVGTDAVAFAADGRLYGTDRNGTPIWKPSVGPATAAPVAAAGTACLPLTDGSVRCVRAADGAMMPRITQDATSLKSLAGNATLLFAAGADGSVSAWDPLSGRQRWLYRPQPADPGGADQGRSAGAGGGGSSDGSGGADQGRSAGAGGGGLSAGSGGADQGRSAGGGGGGLSDGSPESGRRSVAAFDGPARLLSRTGEIDVAYPDGRLAGLDAKTGALRWQYSIAEPLAAAPSGDDGGIFLLGASGTLYALRPPGIAAGLGSSPTVAPAPTTRPPGGGAEPPAHQQPSAPVSASDPSDPTSDPPQSDPPDSDPPDSDPPASQGPEPGAGA